MTGRREDLAYWINEREKMRLRKEVRFTHDNFKHGFSDDPCMGTIRYCNVHREDDKVTKWVAQNWRNPNFDNPLLTLGMVAARMINWPDTLEEIGFPPGTSGLVSSWMGDAKSSIRSRQKFFEKCWTSAYTISTCGRAMAKEDYVFDHVLAQVARRSWDFEGDNLSDAYAQLRTVDGLGSFLAAQVIADLKNTPAHTLSKASDFWSWSAPGPGSLRGLEAYWRGSFAGRKITASNYDMVINACYHEVIPLVEDSVGRIHMQDFQNCLCEFSKFIRVKEGDGRVRNTYTARR